MRQEAPDPLELANLIATLHCKPDWRFTLEDIDRGQGSKGLTFCIYVSPPDAYHPDRARPVVHYFPVDPAAFDRRAWVRWLLDKCLLVELHEVCEHFEVEGSRPFAPNHGPGRNPYSIIEVGTTEDAATSFRGERNP